MKRVLVLVLISLAGCDGETDYSRQDRQLGPDEVTSGYTFLQPETQALQDDDFENPGYLWVDKGAALFHAPAGNQPACASCHTQEERPLQGAAAHYPAIDSETGKLVNLEARINLCRTRHQDLEPLTYESDDLLGLTAYIASLSQGVPVSVDVSGPAAEYYEAGRDYFFRRKGQFNLSCSQCHNENWGKKLRGDTISQGHGNAFPAYRLEWQDFGSLHRRLRDCDTGIRAEPLDFGSETYMAVELYLARRAQALPMESPGVRR